MNTEIVKYGGIYPVFERLKQEDHDFGATWAT